MSTSRPWLAARAANPGALLMRVILLDKGWDFFLRLNPARDKEAAVTLFDGATVIAPSPPEGFPLDEREAIEAAYDFAHEAKRA